MFLSLMEIEPALKVGILINFLRTSILLSYFIVGILPWGASVHWDSTSLGEFTEISSMLAL